MASNVSLYWAAQNCASGWTASTSFMICVAFALTLAIEAPMLPVVSARKQISGRGGIAGVPTVLLTFRLAPGSSEAVTEDGVIVWAWSEVHRPPTTRQASASTREPCNFLTRLLIMISPSSRVADEAYATRQMLASRQIALSNSGLWESVGAVMTMRGKLIRIKPQFRIIAVTIGRHPPVSPFSPSTYRTRITTFSSVLSCRLQVVRERHVQTCDRL